MTPENDTLDPAVQAAHDAIDNLLYKEAEGLIQMEGLSRETLLLMGAEVGIGVARPVIVADTERRITQAIEALPLDDKDTGMAWRCEVLAAVRAQGGSE